jgi:phage terminase large subunit GpA-like protein
MLEQGKWLGEDGTEAAKSKRVGFHMSSLYSPWRSFSEIAAEFIRAEGDVGATMNFRNSRLAEPFEVLTAKPRASLIETKAHAKHPPRIVPDWAQGVLATADSQKDHYRYTVRAWGYGNRSRLLEYGIATTGDDLKRRTIDATFVRQNGSMEGCALLVVDSGGGKKDSDNDGEITARVYNLVRSDPTRIRAAKGASNPQNQLVRESFLKDSGLLLWTIDTQRAKDQLFALMNAPDETQWEVHSEAGEDYAREMASEHKVFDRQAKRELWVKVSSGAANHYWDCEVTQAAIAFKLGMGLVPQEQPQPARRPDQSIDPVSYFGGSRRW